MSSSRDLHAELLASKRDEDDPLTERILEAGLEQLLTFGVRRLSIEDIARRLGIARVTIYRRFANKKALVKAVILREGRRIFAEVDAAVIGLPTFEEQIVEGFVAMLATLRGNALVQRMLTTEPDLTLPMATTEGEPLVALGRDYLAGHLRWAQRSHRLRRFDPLPVAEIMCRLTLSFLLTPESCIPLESKRQSRAFARRYLLPIVQQSSAAA